MTKEPPPREEPESASTPLSQRERETSAELRYLDPQLAYLYESGLRLFGRLDEPGAASLLAYHGRELSRGVLNRVLDDGGAERLSLEDEADEATLREEIRAAVRLQPDDPTLDLLCRIALEVPQHQLRRLLKDAGIEVTPDLNRVLKRGRNRARIAHALKLPQDDPRVDAWFRLPNQFAEWEKYRTGGPPPDDVRRAFETLSDLIFGLVAPYYVTEAELEELLAIDTPTVEDAQRLHRVQLRPVQRFYFFGRLDDPGWIGPLREAGFFRSPPDRLVDSDGSWRARPWPEGGYLARVASMAPELVVEVLRSIPAENQNPAVWEVAAKVACVVPAEVGRALAPALVKALAIPGARLFSESVTDFVVRLAEAGWSEAWSVAAHLLFVESARAIEDREGIAYRSNTEWVFPRFGWHDRGELLDRIVRALEALDQERCLDLLLTKVSRVEQLAEALELRHGWLAWKLDFDLRRNPENVVAAVLRAASNLAERIAMGSREDAERVLAELDGRDGEIFVRLRCQVLAAAGRHLQGALDAFICSDDAIHAGHPAREVALVLREQFRNASGPARRAFADAVIRGPDRSGLLASLRGPDGSEPSEEQITEYVGQWQRRRLIWFRGAIPQELHALAEEHGLLGEKPSFQEQELAEVGFYTEAGSWGPMEPSPITEEQLSALTAVEAAEFLGNWTEETSGGTAEGLHSTLSSFGREHPERAIDILQAGPALKVSQADSLLRGLVEVARQGQPLDWDRLVPIGRGLVGRAAAVEDLESPDAMRWRWAVSALIQIVREGCGHDSVPSDSMPGIWGILEEAGRLRLLWDATDGRAPEDFRGVLTSAWNDAAGHFTWAVVAAALCQYRAGLPPESTEVTEETRERARAPVGKALGPILETLLAIQGANAPAVQAVLGQFIPQLHLLAREWVVSSEERLFAQGLDDPIEHPAWTAYVDRAGVYDSVFLDLRPWYVNAATRAREWSAAAGDDKARESVSVKLAGHLIVAVLRGLITPEDDDGLLPSAFENVDASDWGHAYWGVFRSWSDERDPPPDEIVGRLLSFWEWRLSQLQSLASTEQVVEEAKALGWLFHTPHVPDTDVLRLGRTTARLANGELEMYSRWDRMLELAKSDPEGTFEIGETVLLAELRSEYPHVPNDVRPFLECVLRTGTQETNGRARRLIHKLGEGGFRQFRELLDEPVLVGILAFGSLRDDPGSEIRDALSERREVVTPFGVEFARFSSSRGGAPTLVPVATGGTSVPAQVLVLRRGISPEDAKSMLWRRETHKVGSGDTYTRPRKPGPNQVLVGELRHVDGIDVVLYTDFDASGKVENAEPKELAQRAIDSVRNARPGKDGISYLINAMAAGTATPKTPEYQDEILRLAGAQTLEDALHRVRGNDQ